MKGRKLRQRIEAVWEHGTPITTTTLPAHGSRWRYVPRAYGSGGPGWGVWDRREERYIEDDELVCLPLDTVSNETMTN